MRIGILTFHNQENRNYNVEVNYMHFTLLLKLGHKLYVIK
jgi:hypothetical protein